jgi:hypothetical protein
VDAATLYQQALWSALTVAGDEAHLARRLHVPLVSLKGWLRGVEPPPQSVFLAAVDLIVDPEAPVSLLPSSPTRPSSRHA